MFKHDNTKRQIQNELQFLSRTMFKKDLVKYQLPPDGAPYGPTDTLYEELDRLTRNGEINQAENLLFDKIDPNNTKYLELAIDFFAQLDAMEDDYLISHNYTREEIEEGLQDIASMYGLVMPL